MLVQSTQSRKSWKSRSRLVEIDTVDFLLRRLIHTCTCTGKFRIYTAAQNSRSLPYQKVIKLYVQIPPQSATNIAICITCTLARLCSSWNKNPDSFSLAICLRSILILSSPSFIYYRLRFIEIKAGKDSDFCRNPGQRYSRRSVYSDRFVSYRH